MLATCLTYFPVLSSKLLDLHYVRLDIDLLIYWLKWNRASVWQFKIWCNTISSLNLHTVNSTACEHMSKAEMCQKCVDFFCAQ